MSTANSSLLFCLFSILLTISVECRLIVYRAAQGNNSPRRSITFSSLVLAFSWFTFTFVTRFPWPASSNQVTELELHDTELGGTNVYYSCMKWLVFGSDLRQFFESSSRSEIPAKISVKDIPPQFSSITGT